MRDLSHPVAGGMQVYPGDPRVDLQPALEIERDGVAVTAMAMGSHTGTHVDAPAHTVPGGRTMAAVALDELVGDALVLHVARAADGTGIGLAELEAAAPLPERVPAIVVIDTGWARHFGTPRALRHPWIAPEAAATLLARGMRVLAVDALSPDPTGPDASGAEGSPAELAAPALPVHELVLGADGLIVENLTNLDGLPARVRIGCFPLRIDGDGAPVRAVVLD